MNEDKQFNSCDVDEDPATHTGEYIDGNFVCGTIKWIKMPNYPQWPGLIDNDPGALSLFTLTRIYLFFPYPLPPVDKR